MSNLFRLPNRRAIAEEAASWVVAMQAGLSDDEQRRLHEWLKADPAHQEELLRMADYWDAFAALAELADTFPLPRPSRHPTRTMTFKVAAVAAIACVITSATIYLLKLGERDAPASVSTRHLPASAEEAQRSGKTGEFSALNYHTTVGKQLTASLPDGSVVALNTDTSLDVSYSATRRLVILHKGEAIFHVAHSSSRPFQVNVGARVVQAVGTVFNVMHLAQDDLRVTVSEGTVKVLAHEPPREDVRAAPATHPELLVRAGEQAVTDPSGIQVLRLEPSKIEDQDAWYQRGLLVYKGETLDAVIADVSRYTTVRFVISDDSIHGKRVGGMFRAGDVDGLLLALRESFGINARRQGNVVVLTASQ